MSKFVYTGNEKIRLAISGFKCYFEPNQEIEIPEDKIETIKKVLPDLLKAVSKKKEK